eukprot:TRINITY_DN33816_c0_g1_i11.p1 TRINITY_DN33816_c0_g1~~TRINITY_DN33816_c0_g1_i11.p1  ORF type:complete len:537 (-),score=65.38 TRINITY_DN33816_c0_g1_i11:556-2166(-)
MSEFLSISSSSTSTETKNHLDQFIDLTQRNQQVINQMSGKDATFVLGTTGAGKTTTINALCGCEMLTERIKNGNNGFYKQVVNAYGRNGFVPLKIGHTSTSETLIANVAIDSATQTVYVDCPGHNDNRGWGIALANSANILNLIEVCRSVKFVVVISGPSFQSERGKSIRDILLSVDRLLSNVGGLKRNLDHILIIVTNVKYLEDVQNVESVVMGIDPHLRNNVVGLSYKSPDDPQYQNATYEGAEHPGTIEQIQVKLGQKITFKMLGSNSQLNAPLSEEDRHQLRQLQDIVEVKLKEARLEQVKDSIQLFMATNTLSVLKCKEIDQLLQNMKDSFLQQFEQKLSELSKAANARDQKKYLRIYKLLMSTNQVIKMNLPDLHLLLSKQQLTERCNKIINQAKASEKRLQDEKEAREQSQMRAEKLEAARKATEKTAEAERAKRIEAQQQLALQKKARAEIQKQQLHESFLREKQFLEQQEKFQQMAREDLRTFQQVGQQMQKESFEFRRQLEEENREYISNLESQMQQRIENARLGR